MVVYTLVDKPHFASDDIHLLKICNLQCQTCQLVKLLPSSYVPGGLHILLSKAE